MPDLITHGGRNERELEGAGVQTAGRRRDSQWHKCT